MRTKLALVVSTILGALSLIASAQNRSPVPKQKLDSVLTRGRIIASVIGEVDAGKVRVGDPVRMRVLRGMSGGGTDITHAELFGTVVEAVAWSKTSPESRLAVLIDKAESNGHTVRLNAVVVGQTLWGSNETAFDRTPFFDASQPQGTRDRAIVDRNPPASLPSPTLPDDTELHQPIKPMSPTVLVSHKRNVVLKDFMLLVLLDRF